jgi:hypothetical protein
VTRIVRNTTRARMRALSFRSEASYDNLLLPRVRYFLST